MSLLTLLRSAAAGGGGGGGNITFGSSGTQLTVTVAATQFNVPYPASVAADDLLVLLVSTSGGDVTAPAGWTTIYNETTVANPNGGLFIKKATGSESGTLAVTTVSTTGAAQIHSYKGVDPTTPLDAASTNVSLDATTDPTIDIPAITTVTAGAWFVYAGASNSSSVTHTAPDTERSDFGAGKAGALYDGVQTTAGSTGVKTITQSAGRAYWGAMLVLRPAPPSGGQLELSGPGTLTFAATPSASGSAGLSGDGTLTTPTRTPALAGAVSLSGDGTLTTPTRTPAFTVPLALSGAGTLTLSGAPAFTGSLGLSGAGTLTAARNGVDLSGAGTLTFARTPAFTVPLALSGAGTLSTTVTVSVSGSVALSGAGTLARAGVPAFTDTRAGSGSGALTFIGLPAFTGTMAASGSGTLALAGTASVTVPLALSGSGTLAFSGQSVNVSAAPNLSGSGALTTTVTITASGATSLSGAGTLTFSQLAGFSRVVGRSGEGTLAITGEGVTGGSLSLSGDGALTSTATVTMLGQTALSGFSALTFGTAPALTRPLALSGSGTLATVGTLTGSGSIGLSGAGTLGLSGTPAASASRALTGAGTLTNPGTPATSASMALSGAGTLGISGVGQTTAYPATLSGTGTLAASGTPRPVKTIQLAGSGSLGLTGVVVGRNATGSGTLSFTIGQSGAARPAIAGTPSVAENAAATSIAVAFPAGIVAGELLWLVVTNSASTVPPTPAGWTKDASAGSGLSVTNFYMVADGTETGTVTVTGLSGGRVTGIMARVEGINTSTIKDAASTTAQSTSALAITTASLTTATPNAFLLYSAVVNASQSTDITGPAEVSLITKSTGTGRRTVLFSELREAAGATGTRTFSQTGTTALQMAAIAAPLAAGTSFFPGVTVSGSSALGGTGTLTILANRVDLAGSASLAGAGTLGIAGSGGAASTTLTLSGAGTLTGTQAGMSAKGTPALTGAGTLTFSRTVGVQGSTSLSGSGTLSTVASLSGSRQLSGSGTLTLAGVAGQTGTLALSGGSANYLVVGYVAVSGTRALSGSGTLARTPVAGLENQIDRTGNGTLTLVGKMGARDTLELYGNGKQKRLGRPKPWLKVYKTEYDAIPSDRVQINNIAHRPGDWFVVVIMGSWGDVHWNPGTNMPNGGVIGYHRAGQIGGGAPGISLYGFRATSTGSAGQVWADRTAGDPNFTHDMMVFHYRFTDTTSHAVNQGMYEAMMVEYNTETTTPTLDSRITDDPEAPGGSVFTYLDENSGGMVPPSATLSSNATGSRNPFGSYFNGYSGNYGWLPYAIYPIVWDRLGLGTGVLWTLKLTGQNKKWSAVSWNLRVPRYGLFDDEGTGQLSLNQTGQSGKATVQLSGSGTQGRAPVYNYVNPLARQLSGAGTLSLSNPGVVTLSGSGQLIFQNITPLHGNEVNREADGTLTIAVGAVTASATRALTGVGNLSPSFLVPNLRQDRALSGSGTLTLAGSPHRAETLQLSSNGNQGQSQEFMTAGTAMALTGTGNLSRGGSGTQADSTADLTGSGQLSLFSTTGSLDTRTLAGSGTLSFLPAPGFERDRALAGAGTLALTTLPRFADTRQLAGTGSLQLLGDVGAITVSVQLAGSGQMSLFAGNAASDTIQLAGSGTLARAARPVVAVAFAAAGTGSLTLTPRPRFEGRVFFHSQPQLTLSGTVRKTVYFTGLGGLARAGHPGMSRTWNQTGYGNLQMARKVAVSGALYNSSEGSLTISGRPAAKITFARSGEGNLTRVILIGTLGGIQLSSTGQLARSATPRVTVDWQASGGGTNALSGFPRFARALGLAGSGQLGVAYARQASGEGSLTLTGRVGIVSTLGLSGTGTIATTGSARASALLGLGGTGTLDPDGSIGVPLRGSGSLTFSTAWGIRGDIALGGSGQLSATVRLPDPTARLTVSYYSARLLPRTHTAATVTAGAGRYARLRPRPYAGGLYEPHWTGRMK